MKAGQETWLKVGLAGSQVPSQAVQGVGWFCPNKGSALWQLLNKEIKIL